MNRHQVGASIITKVGKMFLTMYISPAFSHTLSPTPFIAEILLSNKHLTKCAYVISVSNTS